jgi:proteasome lid subunit RPN8/RPN11
MALDLTRAQVDEMIAHAHAEFPSECCGLLAGRGDRVELLFRGRNVDHSPYTYSLDPQEQLRFFKDMDARGLELVGIYHSHTQSPAYPSRTDVAKALYPDAAYVIVSLQDERTPTMRAFRIRDNTIVEEALAVR